MKQLPKNKQLTINLQQELENGHWNDHEVFYTEAEISKAYDVSRTTIRQFIEQLVQAGYLYRIQGKGTYIAPKQEMVTVILVVDHIGDIRSGSYPQLDFYHGLQQHAQPCQLNIIALNSHEFEQVRADLKHLYKGLEHIIFFRTSESFFSARKMLAESDFNVLFYGSEAHLTRVAFDMGSAFSNEQFFLYREQDILNLVFQQIERSGKRKIGIAYSGKTVRYQRFQLMQKMALERGLQLDLAWTFGFKIELNNIEERCAECELLLAAQAENLPEIIVSTDDWLVPPLYQALQKLGKQVGRDIAIVSINNYPFAEILYPPLSTVDIPIFQDARYCADWLLQRNEHKQVNYGQPEFIARASH